MAGTPCSRKIPFPSMVAALDELERRRTQPRSRVNRTYKCLTCNHWHLTSSRRKWEPVPPFPIPEGYFAVIVDGRKVWQTKYEGDALRYARRLHGRVVPAWRSRWPNPSSLGTHHRKESN